MTILDINIVLTILILDFRMDQFQLISDFESFFRELEESANDEDSTMKYDRCPQCDVYMTVKTNNQYVCTECGLLKENVEVVDMSTMTSDMNYNTMSNGLRCVGLNSHRYQTILRSQSTNEISPEAHVLNILFAFNHSIGKEGAIPKHILLNVNEQFKHLRAEGTIYRGSILRAILAAMTYYECMKHRLLFKPSDIYEWFDVDSQTYSKGDKKLRELLDHGFLSEDLREINAEISYIHAYATKLELSEEHIGFLHKLMEKISEKKLLNPNAKSSTRALCVLHVFLTITKHHMRSEGFKNVFKCNYGTVRTISLELFHSCDQFIDLFIEHEIPCEGYVVFKEKSKKVVKKRRAKNGRIELPAQ